MKKVDKMAPLGRRGSLSTRGRAPRLAVIVGALNAPPFSRRDLDVVSFGELAAGSLLELCNTVLEYMAPWLAVEDFASIPDDKNIPRFLQLLSLLEYDGIPSEAVQRYVRESVYMYMLY